MKGYSRDKNGFFIPNRLAHKIGIGCPKCDKHFLQDPNLGQVNPEAQKFIREHMHCGQLDALELKDGNLIATGPVALQMMKPS